MKESVQTYNRRKKPGCLQPRIAMVKLAFNKVFWSCFRTAVRRISIAGWEERDLS